MKMIVDGREFLLQKFLGCRYAFAREETSMSRAAISRKHIRESFWTRLDRLSPWIIGAATAFLMAHGIYGVISSHLEGRRFMAADISQQLQMLSSSQNGPYLGHPEAPIFICTATGPKGSRALPLDYISDPVRLCTLARRQR